MTDQPCKNCKPPNRRPGCHGVCDKYLAWNEEHQKILLKKRLDEQMDDYAIEARMRYDKRPRRR